MRATDWLMNDGDRLCLLFVSYYCGIPTWYIWHESAEHCGRCELNTKPKYIWTFCPPPISIALMNSCRGIIILDACLCAYLHQMLTESFKKKEKKSLKLCQDSCSLYAMMMFYTKTNVFFVAMIFRLLRSIYRNRPVKMRKSHKNATKCLMMKCGVIAHRKISSIQVYLNSILIWGENYALKR